MLKTTDLELVVDLIQSGPHQDFAPKLDINELLEVDEVGLFSSEIWRLKQSIHLAAQCGDIPNSVSETFSWICEAISSDEVADFQNIDVWKSGIAKIHDSQTLQTEHLGIRERTIQVANAVTRLRQSGRKLAINAFGVEWDQRSLNDASNEVDGLARLLGGQAIFDQLIGLLKSSDRMHEEIWLCGEMNLGLYQSKQASLPLGWLAALASKYIHVKCKARKPEKAWVSLIAKSTDIAASFDAERYSQYEEIDISPSELWRSLGSSVVWRELFSVAQTPSLAIEPIMLALRELLSQDDDTDFKSWSSKLWNEFAQLTKEVKCDKILYVPKHIAEAEFPTLLSSSFTVQCNAKWSTPLSSTARNDTQFVFLQGSEKDQLIVRPLSITNTAFLETLIRSLWSCLPKKRASDVMGKLLEKVISNACSNKTKNPYPDFEYQVAKTQFQIDFGSFDDTQFTLIEIKAKSLTSKAANGDIYGFLADLSDSFLPMLLQLARHERHFKKGKVKFIGQPMISPKTIFEKIAVSPLSYGPVSDKLTAGAIIRSMANVKLNSVDDDKTRVKQIADFNQAISALFSELLELPREQNNTIDLHKYLLFAHWVDVGQLLYVLDKSNSLENALKPIRHLTFASRDFWTEIAWAEKQGITDKYWK